MLYEQLCKEKTGRFKLQEPAAGEISRSFALGGPIICTVEKEHGVRQPRIKCLVNGETAIAILDTGSPISLVSNELATNFRLRYSNQSTFPTLQGVSGTHLNVLGISKDVSLEIEGCTFKLDLLIISNIHKSTLLLGLDFIRGSGLILDFAKEKIKTDPQSEFCKPLSKLKLMEIII